MRPPAPGRSAPDSARRSAEPRSPVPPTTSTGPRFAVVMARQHGGPPDAGQVAARPPLDTPSARRHTARVRIIAGRFRGQRHRRPARALHPAHVRSRARGAVLHPGRRPRARRARPVRGVGRARARGPVPRRALRHLRRPGAGGDRGGARPTSRRSAWARRRPVRTAEAGAALRALAREGRAFGLVFLDPPYASADTEALLRELLARAGLLVPGAWIVLEHASRGRRSRGIRRSSAAVARTYGDTALTLYAGPARRRHDDRGQDGALPRHFRSVHERPSRSRGARGAAVPARRGRRVAHRRRRARCSRSRSASRSRRAPSRASPTSRSSGFDGLVVDCARQRGGAGHVPRPARRRATSSSSSRWRS